MMSVWQAQSKDGFTKDRKRIKEGRLPNQDDASDDVTDESSEEEVTPKQKAPLSSHSTSSLSSSLDMKPNNPSTISSSSTHSKFSTLPDIKPAQSSENLLSQPCSQPTCDIDPFCLGR